MKLLLTSITAAVCILNGTCAAADSLYGTQVTVTADYPTLGNSISNSVTKTVGPGVEYPSGTLIDTATGIFIIGVNVDVGMSTIDLTYTQNAQALSGTFNGYVFDFSGATITGASLDPSSTFTPQQIGVGFTPSEVTVNGEGVFFTTTSHILVDLDAVVTSSTPPPTAPEPQSYALMLSGLGLAAWTGRFGIRHKTRK